MTAAGCRRRLSVVVLTAIAAASAAGVAQVPQRDGAGPTIWQGTATLTGRVVALSDDTAMRRAVVTVQGGGGAATRSVSTDDDGRFVVRNLPAGRYAVVARKAAYLDSVPGAKRPARPGTAVLLAEGGTADVLIRMARGAVLEGTLRDDAGAPLAGTTVFVFDPDDVEAAGPPMLGRLDATATTDERGVYRIYGLAPGDYVIASAFDPGGDGQIGKQTDASIDALLQRLATSGRGQPAATLPPLAAAPIVGYATTYYPGTTVFADASRVRVGVGEERPGLDFVLAPVPTVVMEGTVVGTPEQLAAVELSFVVDGPRTFVAGSRPILAQRPGADGRFRYSSVPPGRYTIYARSDAGASVAAAAPGRTGGGNPIAGGRGGAVGRSAGPGAAEGSRDRSFAVADVAVFGQDVSGIALVLQPGVTVSGRIAFDAAVETPPQDLTTLRVTIGPRGGSYMAAYGDGTRMGNVLVSPGSPSLSSDGTFVVSGVAPGSYELRSTIPADTNGRWWLRSAMLDGRDLLDEPVRVGSQSVSGVLLTYTDRYNELTGTFQTVGGQPATDYYVVVVPEDRALWRAGSRRLASTRPATDGRFSLTRLPAGNYRLAALIDFEAADLADNAFLESLAAQGIAVTIRDGARTVQDIQVAR